MRRHAMTAEEAEAIALAGLAVLADQPERIGRFLSVSGVAPGDIRTLAATSAFQAAVLTHIRADESLLLVFAAQLDIDPATVGDAEAKLSGQPVRG